MSFNPPEGILDIGNATLRVGKLEVSETTGLNQGLQNIVKNDLLITETAEYSSKKHWGLKLPTTWVAEFDIKGETGKYLEFNFYNEGFTSNTSGYTLNFTDTSLTLKYDNGGSILASATIPTIVGTFRKVHIFFERNVIAVSIDGTRYLYDKRPSVLSRVISTTGSAFLNLFVEDNSNASLVAFKNLRIVNGRFISDETSNIAFVGGNLGVGVNSPQEALDIRGNMHFNRVSNVSQVSVDSNVVTEYTGPHDRPLRKYPEVPLSITSESASGENGYKVSWSSIYDNGNNVNERPFRVFDGDVGTGGRAWMVPVGVYGSDGTYVQNPPRNLGTATGGNSTTVDGEYIILQTPNKIKVKHFKISDKNSSGNTDRAAEAGKLYGSNDGSIWYELVSFSELSYSEGDNFNTVHVNATTYYDRLALVVTNSTATSSTYMSIGELEYYGYEKGSGSLDTTLKTVYNVPATTGTQLEVYYDAKNLTTMPSTVTDLAGGDQNGSVSSVTLDITDGIESFNFDGTLNNGITTTLPSTFVGNQVHSVAFWFYYTSTKSVIYPFHIGTSNPNDSIGLFIGDGTDSTGIYLNYFFFGNDCTITSHNPLVVGTWNHIALVHNGTDLERKLYINNTQIEFDTNSNNGPLSLPASSTLYIGRSSYNSAGDATIKMANFRLYSKALNADQVKELYDYQKDYFFGTKSQVTLYKGHLGIGVTEPSGQLELAGDERLQEYPPKAFEPRQTATTSPNEVYIEGHGHFKAWNTTSFTDGARKYTAGGAFYKLSGSGINNYFRWVSANIFNLGPNAATGASDGLPTSSAPTFAGYKGAHLILELPYPIHLKKFSVNNVGSSVSDYTVHKAQMPSQFVIIASNDGNTWDTIFAHTATAGVASDYFGTLFTVTTPNLYSQYGFVALKNGNTNTYSHISIADWRLFGTPGPTTLNKGSLTLGRSLDAPYVSRYDADANTPAPDRLVLDYDTTVSYEVDYIENDGRFSQKHAHDISGHRRDAMMFDGAFYHKENRAFQFGESGYLQSTDDIISGNPTFTTSFWFRYRGGAIETIYSITAAYSTNTAVWAYVSSNTLYLDFVDNAVSFSGTSINPETWYHVVLTYHGGTKVRKCYVDGVEQTTSAASGTGSTGTLSLGSSRLTIGGLDYTSTSIIHGMNGEVSNFKLYDIVLEPSDVRKLYRLGRTGRSMVIGDTAVGIGKAPEAQLDVRGNLRCDNAYVQNIFCPTLLAQQTCFGGGTVTYTSGRVRWNSDILCIPSHNANGKNHIRITCPASGTKVRRLDDTGESWHTVDANGIQLGNWDMLWFFMHPDGPVTSSADHFVVMHYYNNRWPVYGTNAILIASRFGDTIDNELYFPSIRGRINV